MNANSWRGAYFRRKAKAASEHARARAKRRWEIDAARREALAAMDPSRAPGRIVRRVIVIDGETVAREAVIYDFDSAREARRKLRRVLTRP